LFLNINSLAWPDPRGPTPGELEQSHDFIQWVGYYEAKLAREASYREMMYDYLRKLRQRAGLGALHLSPDKPTAPAT
jgi:hypothetical protein